MPNKEDGETESYSPQKGTLYAYDFDVELRCEQEAAVNGAVYDIRDFMLGGKSYLVLGINAIVRIYMIEYDSNVLEKIGEVDSQIITYKIRVLHERSKVHRQDHVKILVADIMKSLTVYTFSRYPNEATGERFKIETRDPNGLWCIEMAHVPNRPTVFDADEEELGESAIHTREFYLTADFDQNLNLL